MRVSVRTMAKVGFSLADRLRGAFPGPRILIYHQIGAGHGRQMDVASEDFARQLEWLSSNGRDVVSLEDALERRAEPNADRLVVLTFDDGYEDMYRNAFPLLVENRLPFTLYLTTSPVETRTPLAPERESTPVTWKHVGKMAESGLATIAAHTHTHPDLRLLDQRAIEADLVSCDRLIESKTGIHPHHFAYPWGYWSEAADSVVRHRYRSAVLGGGRPVEAGTDPWLVNRIPIQLSDGDEFFARKIARGQRTEEFVRRRLAGYDGP